MNTSFTLDLRSSAFLSNIPPQCHKLVINFGKCFEKYKNRGIRSIDMKRFFDKCLGKKTFNKVIT